jgi:hypothetical protein
MLQGKKAIIVELLPHVDHEKVANADLRNVVDDVLR